LEEEVVDQEEVGVHADLEGAGVQEAVVALAEVDAVGVQEGVGAPAERGAAVEVKQEKLRRNDKVKLSYEETDTNRCIGFFIYPKIQHCSKKRVLFVVKIPWLTLVFFH
jgi:hypothetical protein